ncbi:nucleotidyltransferase domain-containing protein [Candidatus Woesearchaeota archaeon]|nr:nucleotidyltransferase domain-containing protein [Candidatus Woesearchaeota archaeon]
MYKKLNITENHLRILSLFTNGFNKEYYIREVSKNLKLSPRTSQLILQDLEKKGILESKTIGKIKTYVLTKSYTCQSYLILAEQYKSIVFLEANLLIKEIIEKITPFIQGIGVIFGSYAKGNAEKKSDLDIFVVGTYQEKQVQNIAKVYGLDISIKSYPLKTFEDKLNHDYLLIEILKNHLVFLNVELLIKSVFKNG